MYKSIKRHLKIVSVLNLAKKYINIICPTIQDTTKMDCICNIKGHLNTNEYFPSDKNTIVSKNNVLPATTIYQKICLDLRKAFTLPHFTYNKENINYKSIYAFNLSTRHLNDKNNKTRENIIGSIINDKVPEDYYLLNKWRYMRINVLTYLNKISNKLWIKVECVNKAGRGNNYDLLIKMSYDDGTTKEFNVELKFNVSNVDDAPQFVSPMNPSQYLSHSYESHFYDNYLPQLTDIGQLIMPSKDEYMKQIHSTAPKCMEKHQHLYYNGCKDSSKFTNNDKHINFYNMAKKTSSNSIKDFIDIAELNIAKISHYLHTTQKNKIYMLYSNNSFILQQVNLDDYTIDTVVKNANKYRYECISKTGKRIKILLRWKNGNGIAFPSFQIS